VQLTLLPSPAAGASSVTACTVSDVGQGANADTLRS
jgi:hypothetical protein